MVSRRDCPVIEILEVFSNIKGRQWILGGVDVKRMGKVDDSPTVRRRDEPC